MHPVGWEAHSYRWQATGTGRGLSETRDARPMVIISCAPHGFGWDAGSRLREGAESDGECAGRLKRPIAQALIKGSGMLGKRQDAQRGWQGCTAVFQEQGQNRNDLAAYDTAHVRRVRRGCSPAVSWKTAMHPVGWKAHSYRLPSTNEPDGLELVRLAAWVLPAQVRGRRARSGATG